MLVLGDLRIHLVRAGVYYWDGGAFFGVVPKTLWSRRVACDEANRIAAGFNCYLIETGARNILIETGGGDRHDDAARQRMSLAPETGLLPAALLAEGFRPEQIDLVINTHLHWDHCGGNTVGEGEAAFPNAEYVTQRGEWEYAHTRHPRDAVSYRDINYDALVRRGQMRLVSGDVEIAPGIHLEVVPGHNRDMMTVRAVSGGETFCLLADLVPTVVNLQPTWVAAFDLFPVTTIESKARVLRQAADQQWWCGFGHDQGVGFAKISYDAGGRYTAHETLI